MDSGEDTKVARLPVRFKEPPAANAPMLRVVTYVNNACDHQSYFVDDSAGGLGGRFVDVQYLIRPGETEVECGHCHTKLDPMWVLRRLAHEESRWNRDRARYIDEMARLKERERTKCQNCGKMTRISRA